MSQYTHFFIKTNEDKYFPIGTFSRNDGRAAAINDILPYGSLRPLTKADCIEVINDLERQIKSYNESKTDYLEQIEWLKTAEGNLDERLECVTEYKNSIAEINENLSDVYNAIGFYETLIEIIREAEDDEEYGTEADGYNLKGDSYVYAGIEISNPNVTYAHDGWGDPIENKITGYRKEN